MESVIQEKSRSRISRNICSFSQKFKENSRQSFKVSNHSNTCFHIKHWPTQFSILNLLDSQSSIVSFCCNFKNSSITIKINCKKLEIFKWNFCIDCNFSFLIPNSEQKSEFAFRVLTQNVAFCLLRIVSIDFTVFFAFLREKLD